MKERLLRFFFAEASPRPIAVLRTGLCVLLLVQAWLLRGVTDDFLSTHGFVQGGLAAAISDGDGPRLPWLAAKLAPLGVDEATLIFATCILYVSSVLAFGLGLFTRVTSVTTWLLHWTLINTAAATAYGFDTYAHVFLFYLMFAPTGAAPSRQANLLLRVMQLHMCLSYLISGVEKAQGIQWWNGALLWRALNLPVYKQFDMTWLAAWPHLSMLAGWATLILETGYCIFIWPRRTRPLWVLGMCSLHLGIAFSLGLTLFGLIMCVLTVSLFAISGRPVAVPRQMAH